jgi:hypothetical protein
MADVLKKELSRADEWRMAYLLPNELSGVDVLNTEQSRADVLTNELNKAYVLNYELKMADVLIMNELSRCMY